MQMLTIEDRTFSCEKNVIPGVYVRTPDGDLYFFKGSSMFEKVSGINISKKAKVFQLKNYNPAK